MEDRSPHPPGLGSLAFMLLLSLYKVFLLVLAFIQII